VLVTVAGWVHDWRMPWNALSPIDRRSPLERLREERLAVKRRFDRNAAKVAAAIRRGDLHPPGTSRRQPARPSTHRRVLYT
jgi:hypothetical protein